MGSALENTFEALYLFVASFGAILRALMEDGRKDFITLATIIWHWRGGFNRIMAVITCIIQSSYRLQCNNLSSSNKSVKSDMLYDMYLQVLYMLGSMQTR